MTDDDYVRQHAAALGGSVSEAARDLSMRITEYLSSGGLFNPECMPHDKVRDMLIECQGVFLALAADTERLNRIERKLWCVGRYSRTGQWYVHTGIHAGRQWEATAGTLRAAIDAAIAKERTS